MEERGEEDPVLRLGGTVDDGTSPAFLQEAERILQNGPVSRVVIDFSATDFLDSSGLGLLVAIHTQAQASGTSVQLRSMPSRVAQLVHRAGLDRMFEISD